MTCSPYLDLPCRSLDEVRSELRNRRIIWQSRQLRAERAGETQIAAACQQQVEDITRKLQALA